MDARLERLEGLLLEGMEGLASSIGELKNGAAPPPDADRYHALSARLAALEESFARICNVVGQLDQEVRMLKNRDAGS